MPGADQTPLLIESAVSQVRAQVPASARHRKELPADVAHGVGSGAGHRTWGQIGCTSDLVLSAHGYSVHPPPRYEQPLCDPVERGRAEARVSAATRTARKVRAWPCARDPTPPDGGISRTPSPTGAWLALGAGGGRSATEGSRSASGSRHTPGMLLGM